MVSARLLVCGMMWLAGFGPAVAQSSPLPPGPMAPPGMTTDRPEYCGHLSEEFVSEQQRRPPTSPDVRMLAAEGQQMCDRGHFRGGIERLRRALIILRERG